MRKLLSLVTLLTLVFGWTITADAKNLVPKYSKWDTGFYELYDAMKDELSESYETMSYEDKKVYTYYKTDYEKLGNGFYDIMVEFELYGEDKVELHRLYDGAESEVICEYFIIKGERMTYDEMEELYPDFVSDEVTVTFDDGTVIELE